MIDVGGWDCEEQDGGAVICRFFARNYLKFPNVHYSFLPRVSQFPDRSQSVLISP